MKELFQLSFRCTKLKCGVIWAFVVMSAPGPWRELYLGPAACRAPCEKPSRGMRRAAGKAAAFSRVGGTVAKSAYYTRLWASFFVKLREKIPGRGLRFFGLILQNMVAC